jgi:hypothetical protein
MFTIGTTIYISWHVYSQLVQKFVLKKTAVSLDGKFEKILAVDLNEEVF